MYDRKEDNQMNRQDTEQRMPAPAYKPCVTMPNFEEEKENQNDTAAIQQHVGMIGNQPMVNPGQRKFQKDEQGYTEPMVTVEGVSQHMPTPIPSCLTFRGDAHMNSRESTNQDNSATLPIMNNESDEDWSSESSSAANRRLNSVVIKKQSTREDQQMISQNSEPMETMFQQSPHPSSQQMSVENVDTEGAAALQRKSKVDYVESQPDMTKPSAKIDDVPEEEYKLSPRDQVQVEHSTPQIRVTPLVTPEEVDQNHVPSSTPLRPQFMQDDGKGERSQSMKTLSNFGLRDGSVASKLMQRRNKGKGFNLKLSCQSFGSSKSGSVKQYSSEAEMLQLTEQENQARCDFFKHFQYSTSEGNKLGSGCSATVYWCTPLNHEKDIQFVTVKSAYQSSNSSTTQTGKLVVKVCDTSEVTKREAALNESNILKIINCDLINQLVAFYEDPDVNKSYLVLEFAGQDSLTKFMEDKKEAEITSLMDCKVNLSGNDNSPQQTLLSEDLVKCIMRQLFQATEYLHRNNICHRDLKPDNIMISANLEPVSATIDNSSQASGSEVDPIKVKVIDLNVAFHVTPENPRIRFGTGLKEWSAPETRNQQYHDFKIDSWSLGCVMYFISTGQPPFKAESAIEIDEDFCLWLKLQNYQDSPTFPEMVDFIGKLMVVDPENRMTALEALRHPWLEAKPYVEETTLSRLQMKIITEEDDLTDRKIDEKQINGFFDQRQPSKSPLHGSTNKIGAAQV